jgi:hypothetical protein
MTLKRQPLVSFCYEEENGKCYYEQRLCEQTAREMGINHCRYRIGVFLMSGNTIFGTTISDAVNG